MIYVASSWRNPNQPLVVGWLRAAGFDVYDFRHPAPGNNGFAWSEIDPDWQRWTPDQFRRAIDHPIALDGFASDRDALERCTSCILVLPCGRSAHLELGWAAGAGKQTAILMLEPNEPELMYRLTGRILLSTKELVEWAREVNS